MKCRINLLELLLLVIFLLTNHIELLEKNKLNKNLIKFMKARAEKPSSSNSNNIKVKEALYNQILESKGDKVNVETSDATYLGLPIAEAAKFLLQMKKTLILKNWTLII